VDTLSAAGLLIGALLVIAHMLYGIQAGRPLRFSEALILFLVGNGFIAGVRLIFYSVFAFLLDPGNGMGHVGLNILLGGIALSWVSILAIIEIYKQRFDGAQMEDEIPAVPERKARAADVPKAGNNEYAPANFKTLYPAITVVLLVTAVGLLAALLLRQRVTQDAVTPEVTMMGNPNVLPIQNRTDAVNTGLRNLSVYLIPVRTPSVAYAEEMSLRDAHQLVRTLDSNYGTRTYDMWTDETRVWLVMYEGDWLFGGPHPPPVPGSTPGPWEVSHHGCPYSIFTASTRQNIALGDIPCNPGSASIDATATAAFTPGLTLTPGAFGPPITSQEDAIETGRKYLSTTRLSPVGIPSVLWVEKLDSKNAYDLVGQSNFGPQPRSVLVWLVIFEGDWLVIPPVISPTMETAAPHHGCVYTIFVPYHGSGSSVGECKCVRPID
jgi:hypothetical protein